MHCTNVFRGKSNCPLSVTLSTTMEINRMRIISAYMYMNWYCVCLVLLLNHPMSELMSLG